MPARPGRSADQPMPGDRPGRATQLLQRPPADDSGCGGVDGIAPPDGLPRRPEDTARSRRPGLRAGELDGESEPRSRRVQTRTPTATRTRTVPHRWRRVLLRLGTGLALVIVAGVAVLILTSRSGGPAHLLTTPARLGAYVSKPQLGQQMGVAQLKKNIVTQSAGAVGNVVSAVYENGSSTPGGPAPQILLFIGGHLSGASPAASIRSFTQHLAGARLVSPGKMGGEAACVSGEPGSGGSLAACAWFDNDTFGEVVSPNLSAAALANEMRAIRPLVERVAR